MKKRITTIGMAMLMGIIVVLSNGCKGKDGAPGATGPQGATGNANVHVQNGYSMQFSSTSPYAISATDPSITQQIYDAGAVQVYIQNTTSTTLWEAVPDGYFYPVFINVGGVYIGSPTNWTSSGDYFNIKVVTIPPAIIAQHPHVNMKNYTEVAKTFGLN